MTAPIATFTSTRFIGRDTWELYDQHLRWHRRLMGKIWRTQAFPLSTLEPAYCHSVRRSAWVLPTMMLWLIPGALAWAGSVWLASRAPSDWIPARSLVWRLPIAWIRVRGLRLLVLGLVGTALAACFRHRYVHIAGTPAVSIKYSRWNRDEVDQFVGCVMQQIATVITAASPAPSRDAGSPQ